MFIFFTDSFYILRVWNWRRRFLLFKFDYILSTFLLNPLIKVHLSVPPRNIGDSVRWHLNIISIHFSQRNFALHFLSEAQWIEKIWVVLCPLNELILCYFFVTSAKSIEEELDKVILHEIPLAEEFVILGLILVWVITRIQRE